jgi:acetoin utilization protein AcuB
MLVGERMSRPVITIHPDLPIQEALNEMRREGIRRFPVVDKRGRLVGIVSERDLLHASPSDATSLSIFELNYLISRITVSEVMTEEVMTVTEDTPVEVAARMMADNKIGGLPVTKNGDVVGMITETDLFKLFLEILGARYGGLRVTASVPNIPGELAQITSAVYEAGGNIISLSTALGETTETGLVTFKIEGVESDELKSILEPLVEEIVDLRQVGPS